MYSDQGNTFLLLSSGLCYVDMNRIAIVALHTSQHYSSSRMSPILFDLGSRWCCLAPVPCIVKVHVFHWKLRDKKQQVRWFYKFFYDRRRFVKMDMENTLIVFITLHQKLVIFSDNVAMRCFGVQ